MLKFFEIALVRALILRRALAVMIVEFDRIPMIDNWYAWQDSNLRPTD